MATPLSSSEIDSLLRKSPQKKSPNPFLELIEHTELKEQNLCIAFQKELNKRENRGQKLIVQFLEKKISKEEFDLINEKEMLGFDKWWSSEAGWILQQINKFTIEKNKNNGNVIEAKGIMSYESGHVVYGDSEIMTRTVHLKVVLDEKSAVTDFSLDWK